MTNKIHNFKDSLIIGNEGEQVIYNYLTNSPIVERVIDVSDSPMYQELEVDMLVKLTNGIEYKIEVKTDTYDTGNFYYETVSAQEVNSVGGFEKTTCDYMFYYFVNMDALYILKMDNYRQWFRERQEDFRLKGYEKKPVNRRYNNSTYTSIGYAFPIHLLEENNKTWWSKAYLNKSDWLQEI